MARQVSVKTERNSSARDPETRSREFSSVLIVAWLLIPLLILVLRVLAGFGGDQIKWLIVWLSLLLLGTILPAGAVAYGYKVAKRTPFVIWHVAATIHLFAVAVSIGMLPGWERKDAGQNWYDGILAWLGNVFLIPLWMVIVYYLASLGLALSWLMYRINAFRASTSENGEDESGLRKLLRLPDGARVRVADAVVTDTAVEVPIDHEGVPIGQVRQVLPALDEHPGVVRGRSSVIEGDRGGHSTLRLVHTDPHKTWKIWPGLSAPGGSYTEPIRTSYYSTGETQWYSFVRTPEGVSFAPAPGEAKDAKLSRAKFRSTNDTFKGGQGATASGKSGGSAIECAEIVSRRNVQLVYIDPAKLMQNAAWILDFVSLAAGSTLMSGELFRGLRRVGEHRVKVLGEAGLRNFTDEACEITGMSWVHIYADEFDIAKQNDAMEWLATKGRSLGFRLSFTLPRAVGDKLSTDIRAAVGMWEQYGITQDYDKGFVLSEETIAAGANPENFGISIPGAHYLDRAPGIPQNMWPIDCRTYKTREDYGDLRRAIEAARATFTPMTWTPGELEALGSVAKSCAPSVIRNGTRGSAASATEPMSPIEALARTSEAGAIQVDEPDRTTLQKALDQQRKDQDMQETQQLPEDDEDLTDLPYDRQLQALLDDAPDIDADLAEVERELGPLGDIREPIPPAAKDGIELKTTKPKSPNREASIADLHNALTLLLADADAREIGREDLAAMMRFDFSASWISKRFTDLCEGEILTPPGIAIERIEGASGRFMLTRVGG